jgi:hypothetical protein
MTGPLPSDDQLDRIAERVRQRIEARARRPRQAATALVVVALIAGGVGLLAPDAPVVLSAEAASRSVDAALEGGPSAAEARRACRHALSAADRTSSSGSGTSGSSAAPRLVVCRSGDVLEVFPADDDPAGLCSRNGLASVVGGVVPVPVGSPVR